MNVAGRRLLTLAWSGTGRSLVLGGLETPTIAESSGPDSCDNGDTTAVVAGMQYIYHRIPPPRRLFSFGLHRCWVLGDPYILVNQCFTLLFSHWLGDRLSLDLHRNGPGGRILGRRDIPYVISIAVHEQPPRSDQHLGTWSNAEPTRITDPPTYTLNSDPDVALHAVPDVGLTGRREFPGTARDD